MTFAKCILDPDEPKLPAIPPSVKQNDMVGTRYRLQGAIVKESTTPRYFFVPDVTSALGPTSNKIPISENGDPNNVADKSPSNIVTMGLDKVCFNITLQESVATAPLHLRGDPTQDEVTLTPVVANPLTHIGACAFAQCLQFFLSRPPSHIHPASFYAISPAESRGSVCGWHGYLPHSLFASVRIGRCPIAIKRFVNCVITIRRSQRGVDTVVLSLHALTCPILSERGFAGDLRYAV